MTDRLFNMDNFKANFSSGASKLAEGFTSGNGATLTYSECTALLQALKALSPDTT